MAMHPRIMSSPNASPTLPLWNGEVRCSAVRIFAQSGHGAHTAISRPSLVPSFLPAASMSKTAAVGAVGVIGGRGDLGGGGGRGVLGGGGGMKEASEPGVVGAGPPVGVVGADPFVAVVPGPIGVVGVGIAPSSSLLPTPRPE